MEEALDLSLDRIPNDDDDESVLFYVNRGKFNLLQCLLLYLKCSLFLVLYKPCFWARGGVVVKALRYKPAGRGFDSRWCHRNYSVT